MWGREGGETEESEACLLLETKPNPGHLAGVTSPPLSYNHKPTNSLQLTQYVTVHVYLCPVMQQYFMGCCIRTCKNCQYISVYSSAAGEMYHDSIVAIPGNCFYWGSIHLVLVMIHLSCYMLHVILEFQRRKSSQWMRTVVSSVTCDMCCVCVCVWLGMWWVQWTDMQ